MFFGVIGSRHNHLGSSIAVNSIVHFILDSCKEIFCNLAVQRIVHRCGVNVRDFLIEPSFTCFCTEDCKIWRWVCLQQRLSYNACKSG